MGAGPDPRLEHGRLVRYAGGAWRPARTPDRSGAGQTVVCDTTSINIYKVLHAALNMRPDRSVIVAEGDSFPTDLYMAEGVASTRPGTVLRLEGVDAPTIEELIDERVAVILVNHVNYKSGQLRNMAALTRKAHQAGALIVWDSAILQAPYRSSSMAPMPISPLAAPTNISMAGQGAPAFIYAAQRHHEDVHQPLSGWWGHARPFAFEQGYAAGSGIAGSCAARSPCCRCGR